MTLNSIASKSIPSGTKFVALFADGSGADLFFIDDCGHLYDTNLDQIDAAPDTWLMDAASICRTGTSCGSNTRRKNGHEDDANRNHQ